MDELPELWSYSQEGQSRIALPLSASPTCHVASCQLPRLDLHQLADHSFRVHQRRLGQTSNTLQPKKTPFTQPQSCSVPRQAVHHDPTRKPVAPI